PAGSEALLIDAPEGHLYVEGATGERLVDVNPASDEALAIHLPAARPLFVRRQDGRREYTIAEQGAVTRLSDLTGAPVRVASKGALHIAFQKLFALPFGAGDVDEWRDRWNAAQAGGAPGQSAPLAAVSAGPADGASGPSFRAVAGATAIAAGVVA